MPASLGAWDRLHGYFMAGLLGDIVQAREAYALLRVLGEHSDAVLKLPFGHFFGALHRILLNQYMLSVARMFDRPKGFEIRSIPAAFDLFVSHAKEFPIRERKGLLERIGHIPFDSDPRTLSDEELTRGLVSFYDKHMPRPNPRAADELSRSLHAVKMRRDKAVAHNEVTDQTLYPEVTWKQGNDLIAFAEDFLGCLGFGYLSMILSDQEGSFWLSSDAERASRALEKLLRHAGLVK